jgi:hypothetical protein
VPQPPAPKRCLYCEEDDVSAFRGREHVLPQSFGTFGPDTPVLDCVCDACNAFFGRTLDRTLARETLEGIFRYKTGIQSSQARPQQGLRFTLDENEETGAYAGALVRGVDGTSGKLLGLVPQFHVLNRTTGQYEKYAIEEIMNLTLSDHIHGGPGARNYRVLASSKEDYEAVLEELRKAGISFREQGQLPVPSLAPGERGKPLTLPVIVEGEIDDVHKRALVKILINFATFYLGPAETRKAEWEPVRRYVRYGEGAMRMRLSEKPFWDGQETQEYRFQSDSCNIRLENLDGKVVGVIQMYNLFTYEFILVDPYHLLPHQEIAYRFTRGNKPVKGVKRVASNHPHSTEIR